MEKIKACMVNLSESEGSLDTIREILSACLKPTLLISHVLPAVSHQEKIQEAVESIIRLKPELVLIILSTRHFSLAIHFINSLSEERPGPEIVAFFEDGTSEAAIELLKLGAGDVLFPPFTEESVVPRVSRIIIGERPEELFLKKLKEKLGLRKMIGRNSAFLAEVNKIPQIARCDANALIAGETGTGKEIYARSIHYLSRRAAKPFVAVSCGAIPADLFENELYGHERGAFTAAMAPQAGLIQEAEGGSLFLDDVDCIPLGAQTKVLRFLQEKEFRPLGSARVQHSDTRIIASTNTDLAKAVATDIFRRDLYYRLSVISITLPPLRSRQEDIPLLARHFIEKYQAEFDSPVKNISPGALQMLMGYDWPGNVRELENAIERAVAFSSKALIDVKDICLPEDDACLEAKTFREAKSQAVTRFEKQYIQELLSTHQGNISQSAKAARKDRRAFWELIRKHKIDPRNYKVTSG
jgi:two-component system response regulator GlrR